MEKSFRKLIKFSSKLCKCRSYCVKFYWFRFFLAREMFVSCWKAFFPLFSLASEHIIYDHSIDQPQKTRNFNKLAAHITQYCGYQLNERVFASFVKCKCDGSGEMGVLLIQLFSRQWKCSVPCSPYHQPNTIDPYTVIIHTNIDIQIH